MGTSCTTISRDHQATNGCDTTNCTEKYLGSYYNKNNNNKLEMNNDDDLDDDGKKSENMIVNRLKNLDISVTERKQNKSIVIYNEDFDDEIETNLESSCCKIMSNVEVSETRKF